MRRSGGQQDGGEQLLVAAEVRKAFAGTVALDGVSLRLEPRTTVGLIPGQIEQTEEVSQ